MSPYSTRAALCETQVAAFTDNFDPQVRPVDTDRIVGPIADFDVGFVARFDVCADAAVPKEVRGHAQDRADDFIRAGGSPLDAQHRAGFG